jgi:16S rRNA G1207 methylase RsmC
MEDLQHTHYQHPLALGITKMVTKTIPLKTKQILADLGCGKSVLAKSLVDNELRSTDKHLYAISSSRITTSRIT